LKIAVQSSKDPTGKHLRGERDSPVEGEIATTWRGRILRGSKKGHVEGQNAGADFGRTKNVTPLIKEKKNLQQGFPDRLTPDEMQYVARGGAERPAKNQKGRKGGNPPGSQEGNRNAPRGKRKGCAGDFPSRGRKGRGHRE